MVESEYPVMHKLLEGKGLQYISEMETEDVGAFIDGVIDNKINIKAYWKGYGEALITIYYSPEQNIFTFSLGNHTGLDYQLYQHLREIWKCIREKG